MLLVRCVFARVRCSCFAFENLFAWFQSVLCLSAVFMFCALVFPRFAFVLLAARLRSDCVLLGFSVCVVCSECVLFRFNVLVLCLVQGVFCLGSV